MFRVHPFRLARQKFVRFKSTAPSPSQAEDKAILQELSNDARLGAIPFAHARIGTFFQEPPQLDNTYTQDSALKTYLKRNIPQQPLVEIEADLQQFGQRVSGELTALGLQCEREQPQLMQFDAWGNRVDQLILSPAWRTLHDVSAEEGLIAIAYERKHGEYSRLHQMAKMFLFAPSSGLYSCPLAMTDGAAQVIEKAQSKHPWLKEGAFQHLTSRLPQQFWTSGQWMTEKKGGSDVARGTETVARPNGDGSYSLSGYKWFSSATDADMSLTLARIMGEDGSTTEGTRGLSMFYLEVRDQAGKLNNIQMQRLKNKLGTRQVPTAELLLDNSRAFLVSEPGRGVASIADMLILTRLHNSVSSAGSMRRMVTLARDYSTRRDAFGNVLKNYPLHVQTLARMEVETRAAMLLTLECARLLGREEVGVAEEGEKLMLRLLTPLAKLYTAKQAVAVASEGLESFGGQGYIEDTGLPAMLRDAQVLPIWEGTTNILSLDVQRAMSKTRGGVLHAFLEDVARRLAAAQKVPELSQAASAVARAAEAEVKFAATNTDKLELAARDFAYSLARTYMGALLLEQAASAEGSNQDRYAAQCWCQQDLSPAITNHQHDAFSKTAADANFRLVFDGYPQTSRL